MVEGKENLQWKKITLSSNNLYKLSRKVLCNKIINLINLLKKIKGQHKIKDTKGNKIIWKKRSITNRK